MNHDLIYMDHHATTPIVPEVLESMMPYLQHEFGNPSSAPHVASRAARRAIELAREQVAELINAASPDEIIFTSGATESNNLALKGIAGAYGGQGHHLVSTAIEHKSILDPIQKLHKKGFTYTLLPVDKWGLVNLADIDQVISKDTILITVQMANSEIGTIQPLAEIAACAKKLGIWVHCDAAQAASLVSIDVQKQKIDLLSLSGHKIYGPKGVGALYVKKGIRLESQQDGGGHEKGFRSGTLNVPGIVGLGKAAAVARRDLKAEVSRLLQLRERLQSGIENRFHKARLNGHPFQRLPNNLNYSFPQVAADTLILALPNVALSAGSACASASPEPSHVLRAIGVPEGMIRNSIRFGLGRSNTIAQVDYVLEQLERQFNRLLPDKFKKMMRNNDL